MKNISVEFEGWLFYRVVERDEKGNTIRIKKDLFRDEAIKIADDWRDES